MKKTVLASSILALSVGSCLVNAESGQVFLNPAVGYMDFDSSRAADLDETELGVLGIEYQLCKHLGIEVVGLMGDTEFEGGTDVDLESYRIDGLYYVRDSGKLRPYLAAGIGYAEYDFSGGDTDEEQYNAGFGARYLFSDALSARADLRKVYGEDESTWDTLATLGISFAFGGSDGEREPAPVVAEASMPIDSDRDGVLDSTDQCANTPSGVMVSSVGCPVDSDNDAVADYLDRCPDSLPNARVDSKGCQLKKVSVESIALNVVFPTNSDVVPSSAMSEIKPVADFLAKHADLVVDIEGHSDSMGEAGYNKQLSQRRAEAVAKVLVERFEIDQQRVKAIGYGEEKPIASNTTADGRKANRRVVAVLQKEVEK